MKKFQNVLKCLGTIVLAALLLAIICYVLFSLLTHSDCPCDNCHSCNGVASPVNKALAASVTVISGYDSCGSGVVVRNCNETLVWTNAHVVSSALAVKFHIDFNKNSITKETKFRGVVIQKDMMVEGRKTGFTTYYGRVIRFSADEDIALIRLSQGKTTLGSVRFIQAELVPAPGVSLFHVGSPSGPSGEGFLSKGNMAIGRHFNMERHDLETDTQSFDLVSVAFFPGSSGGGVFMESSGRCIGMLSQMLNRGNIHAALVIPARRIHAFAVRENCLWAFDSNAIINEDELAERVSGNVELDPEEFKKALDAIP